MRKCHLLDRINWIRAVDKKSVEQLISCQKCRAIACRAIAIRAVHPHSYHLTMERQCTEPSRKVSNLFLFEVWQASEKKGKANPKTNDLLIL